MGIGTLRRYHWKDNIQAIADEIKAHAGAIEGLKNANELNRDELAEILKGIDVTVKKAGKMLEAKGE